MTDYIQLASSFYLCETLPDDWNDWDEDTLNTFLTDHAWAPFEYSDADEIYDMIDNLASTFMQVAKEARESTDDEKGGNT